MKFTLRKKIITLVLTLLVFVALSAAIFSSIEIQRYYKSRIAGQMYSKLDEVELLLRRVPIDLSFPDDYQFLRDYAVSSHHRLTLIDSAGVVLFDSSLPSDSLFRLDNHFYRPEVQQARVRSTAMVERVSSSVHQSMYYTAKLFESPPRNLPIRYIRLALPSTEVNTVLTAFRWKILAGSGVALLLIAVISYGIAGKLTLPIHHLSQAAAQIKQGNYDARFDKLHDDELGELSTLLNQMLDKLQKDLVHMKKLEEMRSQFLGNVSHELRTPIFTVQGYLETMMNNPTISAEKQQEFVRKAYNQATRLNNLLTDLIDISRIESGEMKMTFRPFEVHDWLKKVVADLQENAAENSVTLQLAPQRAINVRVMGDRDRLNHVLQNLIINAIKYNVPGGKVEIGFTEHKNRVEIYVADTGRGIAKEHLSRIFERFYRVDKERSRQVGGTGLGLAIVKHIVEAHGSKVFVESSVNQGSRFYFSLRKPQADRQS